MFLSRRAGIAAATAVTLLAAGAAAPAVAGPARSSAPVPAAHAVPAANSTTVLTARTLSSGQSRKKLSPGVTFWTTEALRLNGKRFGTDFEACTVIAGTVAECTITWDFGSGIGSLSGVGDVDLSPAADDADLAVTGGTGGEIGLQGAVDVSFDSATATTYTFTFLPR